MGNKCPGDGEETLKLRQLDRLLAGYVLIVGLSVTMAAVCTGQNFTPPPAPTPDGLAPSLLSPQNPQLTSGVPIVEPNYGSPTDADLSEQPLVVPGSSPDFSDDMMGFGGRGGMGGSGGGGMHPTDSVRYATIWTPAVPVQGQATDFEMIRQDLSFTHPLWIDPLNAFSLTGGVRDELIQTAAILPDTGQGVPSELWGINLGLRVQPATERWLDHGRRCEHWVGERPPLRHDP